MSETWTIRELAQRAADALRAPAQPPAPPLNGRVRDVPGERLIRWYTTIGLVDPPLTRRGRIAQYGRRHLLQLVAIKRLQAAGRSIAEIQAALTGATDTTLERTAHSGWSPLDEALDEPMGEEVAATPLSQEALDAAALPNGETPEVTAASGGSGAGPGRSRGRFWAERPTDGAGRPANDTGPDLPYPLPGRNGALVRGVRLADGVTLVLDGAGRTPAEDDIQAVLTAAAPLLALLEERKLA
ncbi:helix-turn-helix domain-containing protein [Nonomuraea aurantiaca]|uniref:helix-turn-helix domain-containing protein n=1 Tax=Nonomuraea aurantiaca TaxID=2878562 RepID=UPI001CDA2ACD|nr:helix-turn-helix domain-containing protein [Nonomuraea aurantiaca]MCA2226863.1 helix-turn-helix domain-containing protein [Nonomuraea aurantiaca]